MSMFCLSIGGLAVIIWGTMAAMFMFASLVFGYVHGEVTAWQLSPFLIAIMAVTIISWRVGSQSRQQSSVKAHERDARQEKRAENAGQIFYRWGVWHLKMALLTFVGGSLVLSVLLYTSSYSWEWIGRGVFSVFCIIAPLSLATYSVSVGLRMLQDRRPKEGWL